MAEKSRYKCCAEPQKVDFTLRETLPSLGSQILNIAGADAHGKGFGVEVLNADNHTWVLSRIAFEFYRRPLQYEEYTVETWISDYGRLLSTRNFTLTDSKGEMLGAAVSQWAMIDLEKRTAVDLSWVGREHQEAMVEEPLPVERPRKVRNVTPTITTTHKIVYSDIDFNRHVNTMRYFDMMIDMLPLEVLEGDFKYRFDIHFLRESRYGQTLEVGCEMREGAALFEIKTNEEVVAVRAAIEWYK